MAALGVSDTVVVVTGGDPVARAHLGDLPPGATVVAADSGVDHAHALGLHVAIAVGDFDSVSPAGWARLVDEGAVVERHPAAKDASDLALALDAALALGPGRIHVLGGAGGRLDHLLANVLVLAAPDYAAVSITARMGPALVTVVRDQIHLYGPVGDLVSLFAVHGPATGVTSTGLRFPLRDDVLQPGSTRGLSNVIDDDPVEVAMENGVLVAVQPGLLGSGHEEAPPS